MTTRATFLAIMAVRRSHPRGSGMKRPVVVDGDIARVSLTQGYEAIIDADDAPLVGQWNWYASVKRGPHGDIRGVYAMRTGSDGRLILMHRFIAGAKDGFVTDHRDGNGLNNTRHNLRTATRSQNSFNQRLNKKNTSGVKGVYWSKNESKWRARVKVSGRNYSLGYYEDIEAAANAVRAARAEMHGEFANHGETT